MQKYEINADERLDEVNDKLSLIQKKKGMTFGTDALLLSLLTERNWHILRTEIS